MQGAVGVSPWQAATVNQSSRLSDCSMPERLMPAGQGGRGKPLNEKAGDDQAAQYQAAANNGAQHIAAQSSAYADLRQRPAEHHE